MSHAQYFLVVWGQGRYRGLVSSRNHRQVGFG